MSTRCYVVKKLKDGNYRGIYIHNDGYIFNGVGETLYTFYNNEKSLDKLLDLGDLSYLGENALENVDYWNDLNPFTSIDPKKCGCYFTRGEDRPAIVRGNIKDFQCENYCYLWDNDWYVYNYDNKQKNLLKDILEYHYLY